MTLSEGLEAVGRMLNAMPNGRAGVADSYIGNMAALLCTFPRVVAQRCADPVHGVVTKTSFTPTVAEVVKFCEPLTSDMHRVVAREDAIAKQLEEREEWDRRPAPPPLDFQPPPAPQRDFQPPPYAGPQFVPYTHEQLRSLYGTHPSFVRDGGV